MPQWAAAEDPNPKSACFPLSRLQYWIDELSSNFITWVFLLLLLLLLLMMMLLLLFCLFLAFTSDQIEAISVYKAFSAAAARLPRYVWSRITASNSNSNSIIIEGPSCVLASTSAFLPSIRPKRFTHGFAILVDCRLQYKSCLRLLLLLLVSQRCY